MDGNNLHAGILPPWTTQSDLYVVSSLGAFSCPTITLAASDTLQLFIDASYYDYTGCICDRGTYGSAPRCDPVPSQSQIQVAASASISTMFSPAQFGERRVSVGIDTSWLLSPPANSAGQLPVVIYLTFFINETLFEASTDVITTFPYHSFISLSFIILSCIMSTTPRVLSTNADISFVGVFIGWNVPFLYSVWAYIRAAQIWQVSE
jgi:hypothetical protein